MDQNLGKAKGIALLFDPKAHILKMNQNVGKAKGI